MSSSTRKSPYQKENVPNKVCKCFSCKEAFQLRNPSCNATKQKKSNFLDCLANIPYKTSLSDDIEEEYNAFESPKTQFLNLSAFLTF